MNSFVDVRGLTKSYGKPSDGRAVSDISFSVPEGKLTTLLGPSGCGKTTTLRCIAGLERPDCAEISIAGEPVVSTSRGISVPPEKRGIGMVFQSYAVWPHMTVFDNVAFPLRMRGDSRDKVQRQVNEVLELVGLHGLGGRYATKLSGGQQQRIALARALVFRPRLLLLDEPLSNLDAKLRERMRSELLRLQREVGITAIYVTHDQEEAMSISDQIIILRAGRIEQLGDPRAIHRYPANAFVADFIGVANFLEGTIVDSNASGGIGTVEVDDGIHKVSLRCSFTEARAAGERALLCLRWERLEIVNEKPAPNGINVLSGKLVSAQFLGSYTDCRVTVGTREIRVKGPEDLNCKPSDPIYMCFHPEDCLVLPRNGNPLAEPPRP